MAPSPVTPLDVSDATLMQRIAHDDARAFDVLCKRHGARVGATARKLTGSLAQAEEVAQDVWLGLWSARGRYRNDGRFSAYLATLVLNRARNVARSNGRRREDGDLTAANEPAERPSGTDVSVQLENAQRVNQLKDALCTLSETEREALVLRYADELSYEEIAKATALNAATLRSRVFYALRALRDVLQKD